MHEELWDNPWGERGERGGINSPVTIVDGRGERGCGPGPTINLEQYTDYVLEKYAGRREWAGQNGRWPWGEGGQGNWADMQFGVVNQGADVPSRPIGGTVLDAMYVLNMGLVCKNLDAGAGTQTLTVTYYDILLATQVITLTLSLASTGKANSGPTDVFLLGGGGVSVSCTQGGVYGAAKYDAFVGLRRVG